MSESASYGMIGRYASPDDLVQAVRLVRSKGYTRLDAYTPFPVHGLSDALGAEDARLPWLVFLCGLAGAVLGYALQYFVSVIDYPLNLGGRPFHSWPSFIPVTFETTVLLAAFGSVFGMFALNGLPRPHHPVFGALGFERASTDAFFLCIEASDPLYGPETAQDVLKLSGAVEVTEVAS